MTPRTPSAAAAPPIARRSAYLLPVTAALLLAGVALAAPAAAVDDPSRPDARVTHGPSCHPGGVVVEVTGGTVDYDVTFATTRFPGGEDAARVPAGATVVLRTGDVAWGETIDGRLEYTALDGSGTSYADELEGYTFTRPAEEDCAAIAAPAAAATVPPVEPGPDGAVPVPGGAAADGAPGAAAGGADGSAGDVRPDGTRPGGTDAPGGVSPGSASSAGKVEASAPATSVQLVETVAAPGALAPPASQVPLLAAAAALGAASAGLAALARCARRAARRPTRSA